MENKENNFENEVKNIENNVNTTKETQKKKSGKGKTIALMVIVLILVLAIGVLAGIMFSDKNKPEIVKQIEEKIVNNEEEKVSKKIDESKPWVYDADYCTKNENKKSYALYTEEVYNSKDDLKVPFINVNSDYAKKANEDIKANYEKIYELYGKEQGKQWYRGEMQYKSYDTENILSVAIESREGWSNAGWHGNYTIYNINLQNLEEATFEEVYKECGFSSLENVKENAEIALANLNEDNQGAYDGTIINYNKYFLSKDGLNFIIPNPMGNPVPLTVKPGMKRIEKVEKKENDETNNDNTKVSIFEINKNLEYTSNLKDKANGRVAIFKLGEKTFQTEMHDGYYTYKDGYGISKAYDIKEIIGIGSEYVDTSVDAKVYLFKCTIAYVDKNNEAGSFDVALLLDVESKNASVEGIFDSFTGSTRCMKMFGDYAFSYKGKQEKEVFTGCKVINEYEVIYSKKNQKVGDIFVYTDVYGCGVKSTIHIKEINEIQGEGGGAAGTYYHVFNFVGEQEATNKKITGKGVFAVSGDGTNTSYRLELDFNSPIMKATYNDTEFDVIGSTDGTLNLEQQN